MKKRDKFLVLTVDDDELINQILGLRLKELGYAHKSYTNPQDFLVATKTLEPDLCIVDLNLGQEGVGFLMRHSVTEGRKANPDMHFGICGEHGGEPKSIEFCHKIGLDYVSCSPYRVPIARLSAAQAAIKNTK